MSITVSQFITNTREVMDASLSSRWTDAFIKTVGGIVHGREYSSLLGANPYLKFATRTVTTDSNGQIAYTALDSGTGDTAQTHYRILSITDGFTVYRQTDFVAVPIATTTNYDSPYQKLWYDAGSYIQILPKTTGLSLTATVNYTPPRIDQLSSDSVTIDFPDGHEVAGSRRDALGERRGRECRRRTDAGDGGRGTPADVSGFVPSCGPSAVYGLSRPCR